LKTYHLIVCIIKRNLLAVVLGLILIRVAMAKVISTIVGYGRGRRDSSVPILNRTTICIADNVTTHDTC
jgi:hypothetical protein